MESDAIGFEFFGSKHVSQYVRVKLPFRITFHGRQIECDGNVVKAAPYLANTSDAWFLAKDGRLLRCNSPQERAVVVRNGGILYLAEDVGSSVMVELADHNPQELALRGQLRAEVEFEQLHPERPTFWGYYKVESLAASACRYDCEAIRAAFDVGLDSGAAPAYFAPGKAAPLPVISGTLRSIRLSRNGEVIGAIHLHR